MKNPFTALFRARDKPQDSVSAAPTFYFGTSGSGKAVNAQTAIQLSTVYACVRVISETVASLPLGVYEAKEDGNRKATEHPLYRLIHDEPNSFCGATATARSSAQAGTRSLVYTLCCRTR